MKANILGTALSSDDQRLLGEARNIEQYLDGLAIPSRGEDGEPLSLLARLNVMAARSVQAKKELIEPQNMAAIVLETTLNAAEVELERLSARAINVAEVMQRIPTVARLYYTGLPPRRYRRASTISGPGEPLVHRSHVEREFHRIWSGT